MASSDSIPAERATERLYYTNAYLGDFEGQVVSATDGGTRVYLDATAFYPTSGGQPHDGGTLDGIAVIDVIDEGDRIAHVLASRLDAGPRVRGTIDWTRRFDHMQQHTGQHLLSAVFADQFRMPTVSVHFGDDYATLDLQGSGLSPDQAAKAENQANQIVFENRPVTVSFEQSDRVTGLRKASDRGGMLRVVTIRDLDRSACGGTHVSATGEIGPILIRGTERVRDVLRVQFVCGGRALRRARADYRSVAGVAAALSCRIDEVPDLVVKTQARLKDAEQRLRRLERETAEYRAKELRSATPPSANGLCRISIPAADGLESARALAQALGRLSKVLAVAAIESSSTLLVATSEDSGLDAAKLLRDAMAPFSGRGGGSPRLAQGSLPTIEALHGAAQRVLTATD